MSDTDRAAVLAFLDAAEAHALELGEAYRSGMYAALSDVAAENEQTGTIKAANESMKRRGALSMIAALKVMAGGNG